MELNFREYGSGPPFVILHGLFGTLDNWQTIARLLSPKHTVYLLDLRNHGRSPHSPDMSFPLMAADVKEFMEKNWIYEAIVAGHSMGGKVAMQMAFDYPDFIKKLIVIDITPKKYSGGHEDVFAALLSIDLKTVQKREEVERALMERLKGDVGVVQFLLKDLTRTPEGNFEWKMNLPVLHNVYPELMGAVYGPVFNKPALFIKGGNSHYIQPEDEPVIRESFPQARIVEIPGAGHWVHADKPQALFELMDQF